MSLRLYLFVVVAVVVVVVVDVSVVSGSALVKVIYPGALRQMIASS